MSALPHPPRRQEEPDAFSDDAEDDVDNEFDDDFEFDYEDDGEVGLGDADMGALSPSLFCHFLTPRTVHLFTPRSKIFFRR